MIKPSKDYEPRTDQDLSLNTKFILRKSPQIRPKWDSNLDRMTNEIINGTRKYSILMVSDLTIPKFGGVETHGFNLAQCLIARGHKVTFMGNKFNHNRSGVRMYPNGMKFYYL